MREGPDHGDVEGVPQACHILDTCNGPSGTEKYAPEDQQNSLKLMLLCQNETKSSQQNRSSIHKL